MRFFRKAFSASWGTIVYSLLQGLALAIITREGGELDTGIFLLAQGIATPVSFLTGLRLRDQIATSPTRGLVKPYTVRQVKLSGPVILVGVTAWFLFASTNSAIIGSAILVANLAQAVAWTLQGGLLRQEEFDAASGVDAILGWLAALAIAFGYVVAGPSNGLATGTVLMAIAWILLIGTGVGLVGDGSWSAKLTTTVGHDIRMGFSAMGAVGQNSTGRIGTSIVLGQAALARLGTGSLLVRLSQPVARGMLKVNAPRLAKAKIAGRERLRSVENSLILLALILSLVGTPVFAMFGWFAGGFIVEAIFSSSVLASDATYAMLMGAAPILYASMVLNQLIVSRQNSSGATLVSFIALGTTLVTIWPLATVWGEPGAAAAIGAGYVARCVVALSVLVRSDVEAYAPASTNATA